MSDNEILPVWNLGDLYASVDDPRIEEDLQKCSEMADAFASKWKGHIQSEELTAADLAQVLKDYIDINLLAYKPDAYSDLLFASDTSNNQYGALMQKTTEAVSAISAKLIFFDLELGNITDAVWERIGLDPVLDEYRHYIEFARETARYNLSEAEETILEETANCRGRAFGRLWNELVARLKYPITIDGEKKELNQSELLALSYDARREVRREAASVLGKVLNDNVHPIHFAYNTLILEKITMDRLRGFTRPEQARNIGNELDDKVVDTMIDVCVKNFGLVSKYYDMKRKLLGLDKLYHYDRYAPIDIKTETMSFAEAKDTVLAAYERFSPKFREIAQRFFDNNWIDAALAPGKRGGAFCAGITPELHPYVLLNYTGQQRDVMTLAHELGHGIHDVLASKQNLLNFHPVLPLAETASTFAELLCFEKMLEDMKNPYDKIALYASTLEDIFATVFRQAAMYRFEQKVFNGRIAEGELSADKMSSMWQESIQEMFGDSLELGEDHAITWLYVPHFVNTPFYVYAYAFGELLVLSLFAKYRQEGEAFKEKYIELLSSGGSDTPAALLAKLGIDIADPAFWQSGCDLIDEKIEDCLYLVKCHRDDWYDEPGNPSAGWGDGDDDGWDGSDEDDEIPWPEE
ncbi:MAG: M3 family oligoendopeptidase [bacterium]|nr:M3 family oligoendopeptidase [bacterium]